MLARLVFACLFLFGLETSVLAAFAANNLSCRIFAPAGTGVLARCEGPSETHGGVTIELVGQAPNAVSEVRLSGEKGAFRQSLKLSAEPLVDVETVGVLYLDFNFDGFEDFAIMEFLPAGPNVPYLYYLYDPGSGRFVPNAELANITSPVFKASSREIVSYWRDGAAVSGTDILVWEEGKPRLKRRIEQRRTATSCEQKTFAQENGKLTELSKGTCE